MKRQRLSKQRHPLLVLLLAASGPLAAPAAAPPHSPVQPFAASQTAAGDSFNPSFSGDGRYVVFESMANNLVADDNRRVFTDVFVRDLQSEAIWLVSVNLSGHGGGLGNSYSPSISSNGQMVAFLSEAPDLVVGDDNGAVDVFVRDWIQGTTRMVSRSHDGAGGAQGENGPGQPRLCANPIVSADGRWVVFDSVATNLVAITDDNQAADVFAHDLQAGVTMLASAGGDMGSPVAAGGELGDICLSATGIRVAFSSAANAWLPHHPGSPREVYVRDFPSGEIIWIGAEPSHPLGSGAVSFAPRLSGDGSRLAYQVARSTNEPPAQGGLVLYDLNTMSGQFHSFADHGFPYDKHVELSWDGSSIAFDLAVANGVGVRELDGLFEPNISPHHECLPLATPPELLLSTTRPSLSRDGRRLSFVVHEECANRALVVVERDPSEGGTWNTAHRLVVPSQCSGCRPVLSQDGTKVAFESLAEDLVPNDLNRATDVFVFNLESNELTLVSRTHAGRAPSTGVGLTKWMSSSISYNGRAVAYSTLDNVVVPADTNWFEDLFVAMLDSGAAKSIVSVVDPQDGVTNRFYALPSLSGDGNFMAYVRAQGEWLDGLGGSTGAYDKYLVWRNLRTGDEIEIAEVFADPIYLAGEILFDPAIGVDGQSVVYGSRADEVFEPSIYLWQRSPIGGAPRLISGNLEGAGPGNGPSVNPIMSPDGRWIAYESRATDLTTNRTSSLHYGLFAYSVADATTHLVSHDAEGVGLPAHARITSFSGNSRFVAFHTEPNHIVYRHDLAAAFNNRTANEIVCTDCSDARLNFDGTLVVYATRAPMESVQVVLENLATGETKLISRNPSNGDSGNGDSGSAWISLDGRYVVFSSEASNLVPEDDNGMRDVFLYDRSSGQAEALSRSFLRTGTGDHRSFAPVMSGDGRTVVFQSFAGDLLPGDYNLTADAFLVRLSAGDSDGDGLEDDWEVAYFDNLDQDGGGDFDGDGHTDAQEHAAGTNPTDNRSILRVTTLQRSLSQEPSAGATVRIFWTSVPGRSYRVEFKDEVGGQTWNQHPEEIFATGEFSSVVLPAAPARRYYRIRLRE